MFVVVEAQAVLDADSALVKTRYSSPATPCGQLSSNERLCGTARYRVEAMRAGLEPVAFFANIRSQSLRQRYASLLFDQRFRLLQEL